MLGDKGKVEKTIVLTSRVKRTRSQWSMKKCELQKVFNKCV